MSTTANRTRFHPLLPMVRSVVAHKDCHDGLAAAMMVRAVMPEIPVRFVQYNTREHEELSADPGLLFVDFSPPKARAVEFLRAESLVLDHHPSARVMLQPFVEAGLCVFADNAVEPGVSGAVLAFKHVFERLSESSFRYQRNLARIARLAGIYDTWQRTSADWAAAAALREALLFWTPERWLDEVTQGSDFDSLLAVGPELVAKIQRDALRAIARGCLEILPDGRRVLFVEGTHVKNDAPDLALGVDLVLAFRFEAAPDEKLIVSARSRAVDGREGFDCEALAVSRNGGGHRNAAGFSIPLARSSPQPYELLRALLADYLSGGEP